MTTYLTTSEMTRSSRFKSLARMRPDLAAAVLGGAPFSENEDEPIAVRQPLDAGMSEALVLRTMASGSGRDDDEPPDDDEPDYTSADLAAEASRRSSDGQRATHGARHVIESGGEPAPSDDPGADLVRVINERTRY